MFYEIDPATCFSIFDTVETHKDTAANSHTSVSGDIDSLGATCATGPAAPIQSALNKIYNRALTPAMSTAEQHTSNAVSCGRQAVHQYQLADQEQVSNAASCGHEAQGGCETMINNEPLMGVTSYAQSANSPAEVKITDGKKIEGK